MSNHLRQAEKTLGNGNDIFHLLDRRNALLDCLRMGSTSTVEDATYFLDVPLSPVLVRLANGLLE